MKSNIRYWSAGFGALALCSLLTACGSNSGGDNGQVNQNNVSGAGTLDLSKASGTVVWAAGAIAHKGLRAELIHQFEKEHPSIKIKLVQEASDTDTTREALTTQIGGEAATPDVYLGDVVWPAQFGQAQLALSLNKYLPSSFFNRFANGLVQAATYKGNIYSAPFFVDSGFLYYRKDLLAKAGLQPPTSWEQVKQDAAILQQKGGVKYGFVWQGASYEGLTCDFMEYLADAGGQVLNAKGQPALDSPAAAKALTFMKSLIDSGVSPKAEVTFKEDDAMNTFNNGQAAFLRNWDYAYANSQDPKSSKVVGKVGVMPLPTFSSAGGGPGASTIGGWDLFVNPHTNNLAASLVFIDWLTGKEAQTIMATQFSEIPTNAAVQADPQVQHVNPVLGIVSKVHYVSRPAGTSSYPQVSEAIYQNINHALSGGVTVEQALKSAEQALQDAVGTGTGL